jgi:NAD+ diphosphatase
MSNTSQVPNPAHIQADSMLARRFGKETVNYFSSKPPERPHYPVHAILTIPIGSPLNRLSFLRSDHPFLSAAIRHPSTRFVILKDLAPLTRSPTELYYAKYDEVRKLVPETIYDKSEEDLIIEHDSRKTEPHLIFLGLDEAQKEDGLNWKIYFGTPYFALDASEKGSEEQQASAKEVLAGFEGKGLSFLQARVAMTFSADEGRHHIFRRTL